MSPTLTVANDEAAILGRAVDAANWSVPHEAAWALLALHLSPSDRVRMDDLATKARTGELSEDEEIETESYRRVGYLMEVLKSKARLAMSALGRGTGEHRFVYTGKS